MNTHPDFEKLLQLLEREHVEYMIVGGYAVAFHGYPRFTKDLDIFFHCSETNSKRIRMALIAFGFSEKDLPLEAFTTHGNVLMFGVIPTRVDLLNTIDGVSFEMARPHIVRGFYGNTEVAFIGFDDLIKNKKATTRLKDKSDVEELNAE